MRNLGKPSLPTTFGDALDLLEKIQRQENEVRRRVEALASKARGGADIFLEGTAPWSSHSLDPINVPGMITSEERHYFRWLASQFTGKLGEAVELGPWLGLSTNCLCQGLLESGSNKKIHVFDDFIWRASWMDGHVAEDERLPNHASFIDLFWKYNEHLRDLIELSATKFVDYDGNDSVDEFVWTGGAIELLIVDCGRTLQANEAWYQKLREFLIPNETIVVMQDYGVCYEVPRMWYNQTLNFVGNRGQAFQKIHEVLDGCTSTFLYRGGKEETV